jgi:hypothetical protein
VNRWVLADSIHPPEQRIERAETPVADGAGMAIELNETLARALTCRHRAALPAIARRPLSVADL